MAHAPLSRQALYERLWEKPATKVAAELGIKDVKLITICERHNIPKPGKGHWMKVAQGKPVDQPPLPPVDDPKLEVVSLERPPTKKIEVAAAGEAACEPAIPVPERLKSPHPMVAAALARLREREPDSEGLVHAWGKGVVRISVTKKNVNRAARIINAFMRASEAKGFWFQADGHWDHTEVVMCKGKWTYRLKIREHLKRTTPPLTKEQEAEMAKYGRIFGSRHKYVPDDTLMLAVGDYDDLTAHDTTRSSLEEKLGLLLDRVQARVATWEEAARRRAIEEEEARRVAAEEARREAEAARVRAEEERRVSHLHDEVRRWRLCQDIRAYITEVQAAVSAAGLRPTPGGEFDRWLKWVDGHLKNLDPIVQLQAEFPSAAQEVRKGEPDGSSGHT